MKAPKRILLTSSVLAGFLGLSTTSPTEAALLMYEGFSYGSSNNVALNTLSGSALGLDGSAYAGSGTVQYQSSGLTFGDLETDGGRANLPYNSGAFEAHRGIDFTLTSGTMFGSYLFQAYDDAGGTSGISPVMWGATVSDNTVELAVAGNTGGAGVLAGVKSYSTSTGGTAIATGSTMTANTTYLVLFEVTNMGAASGETQDVNIWVLSEAQFANFKVDGLTTAELQAAALGSTASDVWQKVNFTLNVSGTNAISLTDSETFTLFSYRSKYYVDEVRVSNGSLDEVTPIPEAASLGLLLGGLGFLAMRRQSRRS